MHSSPPVQLISYHHNIKDFLARVAHWLQTAVSYTHTHVVIQRVLNLISSAHMTDARDVSRGCDVCNNHAVSVDFDLLNQRICVTSPRIPKCHQIFDICIDRGSRAKVVTGRQREERACKEAKRRLSLTIRDWICISVGADLPAASEPSLLPVLTPFRDW